MKISIPFLNIAIGSDAKRQQRQDAADSALQNLHGTPGGYASPSQVSGEFNGDTSGGDDSGTSAD